MIQRIFEPQTRVVEFFQNHVRNTLKYAEFSKEERLFPFIITRQKASESAETMLEIRLKLQSFQLFSEEL